MPLTFRCPRRGSVNSKRSAINNADKAFNDDLLDNFCSKDNVFFWRAWRKRYGSSSVKTATVL